MESRLSGFARDEIACIGASIHFSILNFNAPEDKGKEDFEMLKRLVFEFLDEMERR